jgi:predicted CXXCH cytochrome family protein
LKHVKWIILAAAIALLCGSAYAFHDGGVASCSGCHSMHSSPVGAPHLVLKSDESSTCLRCHERAGDSEPTRYHISTPDSELAASTDIPVQMPPGGDFGWLRQDLVATASYGAPVRNWGYERGHNIIAADNEYLLVDGTEAPGGDMPAGDLACSSCHDPHGQARRLSDGSIQYPARGFTHDPIVEEGSTGHIPAAGEAVGTYRLLGGSIYTAYDDVQFPGVPSAVTPDSYNRSEASNTTHVAYGRGTATGYATWGEWCATCHELMHGDNAENFVHPVDQGLGTDKANDYNYYVKTGDLTGVFPRGGPYTSLVPFANNTDDIATLDALATTDDLHLDGAAANDKVMCLSCHRAHAGGWKYIMRWNNEAEFLTLADSGGQPVYPGTDAGLGNQGQSPRINVPSATSATSRTRTG